MAVVGKIEWLLESAWINALGKSSDLSGVTIRRWQDQSSDVSFPCILVHCNGAGETDWSARLGYDQAFVELQARTLKRSDTTGQTINNILAAIRDVVRNANLVSWMNEISGIEVFGVTVEGTSFVDDEDRQRIRSITTNNYATAVYLPEE